uniref:Tight junction protein ZO-1 n=1 Tax=Anopheles minimus TaxID=112268 RepID=A0A182VS10_9DIPT
MNLERTSWDYSTVTLSRVTGYGFGIAVSGGRDNPHFANGDPSIAVSDVLKNGPAEGQLQVNDRIISVNGVSLENVEYATAVQVLRDSGNTVTLMVKRRVPNHSLMHPLPGTNMHGMTGPGGGGVGGLPGTLAGSGGGAMGGMAAGVGMNSHQHQHSISSTGLGLGANNGSQQQIKVIVTKANKKDDFGIVLGCRLFIRVGSVCWRNTALQEISSKTKDQLAANGYSLQEGDLVTRIHNTNCNDSMSLKEAKKIIDGCKERLTLAVLREPNGASSGNYGGGAAGGTASGMQSPVYSHTAQVSNCSNMDENYLNGTGGGSYSGQNLYVQPPTRPSAMSTLLADDKSNLTPRGRSRGPLTDISLQQLDRPSTPPGTSSRNADAGAAGHSRSRSVVDEPPRPPPPRGEDFYATRRQLMEEKPPTTEPRYITFQKEGSVGIRLTGGNEVGIFVTAVQQNSPASVQGLVTGDKILKVNDMDMNGVTREEAVLFLLSLQDRIDLIVQYCKEEFDSITAQQRGDSFHIKTHFHCDTPTKGELSFKAGDVFRVIDTLYNGVVGAWQVLRIGRGHQELQRGVIPNKARAEELATVQFNASKKELNTSESRVSFFRRRRSTHRRSKSLSRENWDDVVFSDAISKFPAYERVVLRHPGFVRPVVIFGPVADIARERLMKDFQDKYTAPLQDDDKGSSKCGGIVRLSNIRDIMDRGKHALLDVTPNAVDRLNYAQFYPIVIFLKADTKHTIKQMRQGLPKSAHKSSKKLFEQCQKLERVWSHVFSTTINLNDPDTWYRKLRDSIDQQQSGAVWMSETKVNTSCSSDPYAYGGSTKTSVGAMSRNPYRYSMPAANFNNSLAVSPIAIAQQYAQQSHFANPSFNAIKPIASIPTHPTMQSCRPNTVLGSEFGAPMAVNDIRMTASPAVGGRRTGRVAYNAGLHRSNPNIQRSTLSLHASSSYGGKSSTATTGSSEQLLYDEEQPPMASASVDNGRSANATVHATPFYNNPDNLQMHDRNRSYTNITNGNGIGNGRDHEYSINSSSAGGSLHGTNNILTSIDANESLSDDFLFPMTTSRLSYASSPESDLELSPGPSASLSLGNLPQLVKSSSDPSIATNQDNLDRDRELGDGMPPPYTNPYEHAPHSRRMTVDNKYGFSSSKNGGGAPAMNPEDAIYGSSTSRAAPPLQGSSNGPHFGAVPDLPPRIDRASKPPNAPGAPSTSGSSLPSRNSSSGGTLGRSAQERLFGNGKQSSADTLIHDPTSTHDEYSSRTQLLGPDKRPTLPPMVNGGTTTSGTVSSLERNANTSLDRSGGGGRTAGHHHPTSSGSNPNASGKANGSYDSVSSYDSYNTPSQLTAQNMRLGPNAPDDLKSVPNNRNGAHPMGGNPSGLAEYGRNPSSDMLLTTARSNYNGTGVHETLTQRNSGDRPGGGMNMPQRPTNLVLDSPRKHIIETKTDYGKYSRNNSASQADYSKPNKGPSMIGSPGQPPGAMGPNMGNGAPFKPVPPPKPKNYRPPVGGTGSNGSGMHHSGQWDNGEPISPRSPDGFYYPPMASSHYHQGMAHNVPSSPNNGGGSHAPGMHPYNPYTVGNGANGGNGGPMYNGNTNGSHSYMSNGVRDMGAMGASNGYNNGNAQYPYGNTYMHRGNMPALHPTDRHALDLAGSREQRGSAFELYRKPQLGTMVGHHHNIRDMEPMMSIHEFNQHQQHLMHQERMRQLQQQPLPPIPGPPPRAPYPGHDPSLPPALPAKPPKKNILKSPLKAIKNAFIKSTRPLRRQVSLVGDADKKSLRPILKRQHSMMEPRSSRTRMSEQQQQQQLYEQRTMYAQEMQQQAYYNDPRYGSSYQGPYSPQPVRGYQRHDAYYPKDGNSTYQNLELESMYGNHGRGYYDRQSDGQNYYPPDENLYANRALIELERGRAPLGPGATVSTLGRRIVRRHSMADRTAPSPSFNQLNRRRMGSERAPHHTTIVDHHRAAMANVSHGSAHDESIYQSKSGSFLYNEAREHTRRTFEDPVYQSRREMHRDHLYQSKQQMQDRIQQSRMVEMQPTVPSQQQPHHGSSPASGNGSSSIGGTTTSAASDRFQRNQALISSGMTASGSSSSSPNSPSSSSCKSGYSSSRNGGEMRERRTQMREQIYQSRKEAMESMAEPVYVSRRELKHEPIYESKNEHEAAATAGDAVEHPVSEMEGLSVTEEVKGKETETDGRNTSEASPDVQKPQSLAAPLAAEEDDDVEEEDEQERSDDRTLTVDSTFDKTMAGGGPVATSSPVLVPPALGTPKSVRATHISNFLKRTAPPVMPPPPPPPTHSRPVPAGNESTAPVYASRTSIETQYTSVATGSQMSLPIGPPNATSTPFASELSLGLPAPRQPITRRGMFDTAGGSLADPIWNVSLQIPPGAIPPGVQQEIYFTVTDPRLSESVGGPPLDMENGETMLSPLVMCGPQGTEFLKPVTLNIPHCAGRTASLGLSLKATDSEKNLQTDWEDIDLPSNTAAHTVSVKVDHF